MVRIAVIGCGHWGPNYVRNFTELPGSEVVACCDTSQAALQRIAGQYPAVRTFVDYRELFELDDLDAVVVATPAITHREIAEAALAAGKHVLVEKPLATSAQDALSLAEYALRPGQTLMVGHIFRFNAVINHMRELIYSGQVGEIRYMDFLRTHLGGVRKDVSALWDLAPHDVSIALHFLNAMPESVSAVKGTYIDGSLGDVWFVTLRFPRGILVHITAGWLDPQKRREVKVVGSLCTLEFDDMNLSEPLRIVQGAIRPTPSYTTFGEFQLVAHTSSVVIPAIERREPLKMQCEEFLRCIASGAMPLSDVWDGYRICVILEAADASAAQGGAPVKIPENRTVKAAAGGGE